MSDPVLLNDTTFFHLIDGKLESSDETFPVLNPATDEPFTNCPAASKDQLDRAVAAARRAYKSWRKTSFEERREALLRFADALQAQADVLAPLLTREQGRPVAQAKAEVIRAAQTVREIVSIPVEPEVMAENNAGRRIELHYRPLGVIGAITPWNAPLVLAVPKMASAIYAGNGLVLKPSPYTPLTTLKLGEIAKDIFPAGLVNILAGGDSFGQWMSEHPDIDKISFTGSVATGKRVVMSGAATMKRTTMELGGNDAAIVLADADPKEIAPQIFAASFRLTGQVCQAIKRLYVHKDIYEPVVQEMTKLASEARVGEGFEDGVEYGPLQNRMQYEKVLGILEDTKKVPGVRITTGGHALNRKGYFIAPTIVADITDGARLVDEEQFGPVLPIIAYSAVDDLVERANNSRLGLGGSVWTKDTAKGAEVASQLEAGVVWVNRHVGLERLFPFGGVKESGIGRQGHSIGVKGDMEPQVVVVPLS